jgi:hypothetical protein
MFSCKLHLPDDGVRHILRTELHFQAESGSSRMKKSRPIAPAQVSTFPLCIDASRFVSACVRCRTVKAHLETYGDDALWSSENLITSPCLPWHPLFYLKTTLCQIPTKPAICIKRLPAITMKPRSTISKQLTATITTRSATPRPVPRAPWTAATLHRRIRKQPATVQPSKFLGVPPFSKLLT